MTDSAISYGDFEIGFGIVENPALNGKVRIHVHPNGKVEVEAPLGVTLDEIRCALRKRVRWVWNQLELQKKDRAYALPRTYQSGETHFYLGRRYVLKVLADPDQSSAVTLKGGQFQVATRGGGEGEVKNTLNRWYRKRAADYFARRVFSLSEQLSWVDDTPKLKLRVMRTQWGNCSPSGTVCLNPRLIKAPRDCIDYVVMHELCHLHEHNHSKRFYALLDLNMPNWRHTKARLDGLAEILLAE